MAPTLKDRVKVLEAEVESLRTHHNAYIKGFDEQRESFDSRIRALEKIIMEGKNNV